MLRRFATLSVPTVHYTSFSFLRRFGMCHDVSRTFDVVHTRDNYIHGAILGSTRPLPVDPAASEPRVGPDWMPGAW